MRKAIMGLFFVLILATTLSLDTTISNTGTTYASDSTITTDSNIIEEQQVYTCKESVSSSGETWMYCSAERITLEILVVDKIDAAYSCESITLDSGKELKICKNSDGMRVLLRDSTSLTTEDTPTTDDTTTDNEDSDETNNTSDSTTIDGIIKIIDGVIETKPVESSEAIDVTLCKKVANSNGTIDVICEREQEEIITKELVEINTITECEKILLSDGSVKTICKTRDGELVQTREQTQIREVDNCEKYTSESGELKVVCETKEGEVVSTEEKGSVENISECKKISNSNGTVSVICNTNNQEIISPKEEIDTINVDKCKAIVTDTGENTILCETSDGKVMSTQEGKGTYEIISDGIKILISEKEKQFEPKEDDVDRLLKDLAKTDEEIRKFKQVAREKELKMERRAKIERVVKDESKIESKFTVDVENKTGKVFENITVIETIPKEVAQSATEIYSDYDFIILEDDPIIEFTIPLLNPGETAEVSYTVNGEVDENVIENMDTPLARFGEETTLADCSVNTADAQTFDLTFSVREDNLANVTLEMNIPYSSACLTLQNIEFNNYSAFACPNAITSTQDAMFREMGFFTLEEGSCNASFNGESLFLDIRTSTDMIVTPLGAGNSEVTFRDWKFVESESTSTLTISIPPGTKLTSFFPRSDPEGQPDYATGIVY